MYFRSADSFNYTMTLWKAVFKYDCDACICEKSYHAVFKASFLRLIHVVQFSWVHSLLVLFYSSMWIHRLFIHWSLDGYLNYFPFWNYTLCCNELFCTDFPVDMCQFLWGTHFVPELLNRKVCVCFTLLEMFVFQSVYINLHYASPFTFTKFKSKINQ